MGQTTTARTPAALHATRFAGGALTRRRYRGRAGFTRVDLIATVAVAGVLALLNIAAVSNSHSGSSSAVCLANLRDLTRAWQSYTLDEGFFPPNPDDGNSTPGLAWVGGQVGPGGPQEFNPDMVRDPTRSLLWPYLAEQDVSVFRCPSDLRRGVYQGSDLQKKGQDVPAARSYSMNLAVGTNPFAKSLVPVAADGAWLDNNHNHTRGSFWRTYATFDDIVAPTPANLAVLLDEDEISINDGLLAFGMRAEVWIDWPATRHQMGGTISFADGHVEMRHWKDPRTAVVNGNVAQRSVPGSVDYEWLRDRISAPIRNPP